MNGSFYNWGFAVGRIAGIRIRLHWSLLLFWLYDLSSLSKVGLGQAQLIVCWLLIVALRFLSIFLHELGHCFAARAVGGDAREVLLWPLGGLAFCSAPNLPRSQFIVAAGGPLVTLLIGGLAFGVFSLVDQARPELRYNNYYYLSRHVLCEWNLYILIFNLIPLYPLDGGRMFHSVTWALLERVKGHGLVAYTKATVATLWASRLTAAAGLLYALLERRLMLGIIFLWALSGAEALGRRLREGEGPDYVFGYDFSRGYRSLEHRPRRRSRGNLLGRLVDRWRQRGMVSQADEQRLDELLAKISRSGMESLTPQERRFLKKMSRHRRSG